jgi:hypothetical protein
MSISHFLFCSILLLSCATSQVQVINLAEDKTGFDVICGENVNECYEHAKSKCGNQFRVHHIFDDMDINMRFECLQGVKELQACSDDGVDCILESKFI